ncbi:HEAT repeat domain-containing protein [Streptomyces sp. HF10]|uniref:HEAT repeat domain-containing protein n=1 Tax=Streptomyces sp. HF10 TaxID=2692233 RepID=UPI0019169097|nr:HEAT repeat domain-containing protein [Streptomyces sp. HF10]
MTEINTAVPAALSGLDAVDWSALTHAYGPADDVPGLLRALCSPDEEQRHQALGALYGNIFHQGSRYPATAAAVPFLIRMAADPALPDRAVCLQLLAALAIGYDEAQLPGGIAIAEWRAAVEEVRAQDPEAIRAEYDAWVEAAGDDRERRMREFRRDMYDHDQHLEAMAAELGAYDAVRAGIPALLPLLGDTDAAVRTGAAYVLAWFPEAAGESLPRLLTRLDEERDPVALATALVTAGLLGDDGSGPELALRLRPFLTAGEPVVRWAAATALARLGGKGVEAAVTADVLAELVSCAGEPGPDEPRVPFHEGDTRGYSAASLTLLADRYPREALDAVTDGLAATTGPASFPVATAALRLAFGDPRPDGPGAFTDLTEPQRRLVRVLAGLDKDTWRWANFWDIVRSWGLPTPRDALRAYVGLPEE